MFEYYTYQNIKTGENIAHEGFCSCIKHYYDTELEETVNNPEYDEEIAKTEYLNSRVRYKRDKIMAHDIVDIIELPSARSDSDISYTQAEKDSIADYKNALKDLPDTIITNDFTDVSFPAYPTCIPQYIKDKIDAIISGPPN